MKEGGSPARRGSWGTGGIGHILFPKLGSGLQVLITSTLIYITYSDFKNWYFTIEKVFL